MAEDNDPFPAWGENATKGDLIRAIIYLRSTLASLAGAVLSMRLNDDQEAQIRLESYFKHSGELDRVMAEIAGKES